MFAQINHMAMISPNYPMLGKFYEAVFGLRISGKPRPDASISVGDGYVGLNILPKRDGYFGGLDHFGMVVDDVETVLERMQRKHPSTNVVKRPLTRPFAFVRALRVPNVCTNQSHGHDQPELPDVG